MSKKKRGGGGEEEKTRVYPLTKFSGRRRTVAPHGADGASWAHLKPDGAVEAQVGRNDKKKKIIIIILKPSKKSAQIGFATFTFRALENQLPHL